uniref:Uncharacterized protein isoform X1 n=1 Tax=Nicotiana tabacum TaxID=4097 RepID=A0A1S4D108_TOBAC|nr:PREDICTED: uncharacterized protein LOC107824664 isoform X1 [Nicotiana tabacum]XP_016506948.1 PREDICTED: uncharacterized protein LOC107824664 isoform X1 [Nicotiana tabacum]XP_016506949.1 PREDICTED: uncharacterized protein LOC107824664 isoform X1 [Nicotiana tabacum]
MTMMHMAPYLVDLCVQKAIDNVRFLGDVGETEFHLLQRILPHCSLEQLMHVENLSQGRDLSPVTDKLWKRFYKIQFGEKSINQVVQDMKLRNGTFKWKQLYEAKLEELEETQQKLFKRIGQYLYLKEDGTARLQYQKNFGKRNHKKKTEVKLGTGQLSVCRRPSSLLQHQEIN